MTRRSPREFRGISFGGVRLTLRGWGFLAGAVFCFVLAYAAGQHQLLYVATLLAALPVAALISVRARRPRLSATRAFAPHVIPAGSTATVSLSVRNTAARPSARALWSDALPWRPGFTPEAELRSLSPRGARFASRNTTTLQYELRPPRRGIFPVGPMRVELRDGFGLAISTTDVGGAENVTVTPEVVALAETGLSLPAGDGESRLVQRRGAGDDDDAMTREYRQGDAMRRVHWRASARHGDLMVRQEEQRSFPEARVIVDTRREGYDDAIDDDDDDAESLAFEWAVRMLASTAVHLRRMGFLVTIEETALPQLESVNRGRRRTWGDEEFLASLASITLADTTGERLSGHASDRDQGAKGPIIAMLGNPETETVDWLLRQRRPGELAVAFLARSVTAIEQIDRSFGAGAGTTAVGDRLTEAGWLVVQVRADDDHAAVWEAVVVETGRGRGNG